MRIKNTKLEGA